MTVFSAVPFVFVNGQIADATQVNADFDQLVSQGNAGFTAIDVLIAALQAKATPVGTVVDYAGSSAPSLWLLCYGQAVSRTTYAALFAVLGETYGKGDGSTTFNLPDLRGLVTAGKDNMGGSTAGALTLPTIVGNGTTSSGLATITGLASTALMRPGMVVSGTGIQANSVIVSVNSATQITLDKTATASATVSVTVTPSAITLGSVGGEKTHTLITSEIPAHTHDQNSSQASGTTVIANVQVYRTQYDAPLVNVPTASAGGGGAHNNVQPTMMLNKIIFAGV